MRNTLFLLFASCQTVLDEDTLPVLVSLLPHDEALLMEVSPELFTMGSSLIGLLTDAHPPVAKRALMNEVLVLPPRRVERAFVFCSALQHMEDLLFACVLVSAPSARREFEPALQVRCFTTTGKCQVLL